MKNTMAPVDPVDRIPKLNINKDMLIERAVTKTDQFLNDRTLWIARRAEYYLAWDDYLTPNHKGPWENSSNIHLPFTETQVNAMHARVMQSFFFMDPWFFIDPQEDLDVERIQKIELLMKYVIKRYANYGEGIYNAIHDWTMDTVTGGIGILSRAWRIDQRRALIIKKNEDARKEAMTFQELLEDKDMSMLDFIPKAKALLKKPYKEEFVIKTVFNGPLITAEDPEKILFAGDVVDSTDLNRHETVIKICNFTRNQLVQFKESGYMDEEVISAILERQPDGKSGTNYGTRHSAVNHAKDQITGVRTMNPEAEEDSYEFACVFDRTSLEIDDKKRKQSLADELVYFVHPASKSLARWTFLDRVHADGKRGLHMAHLYRRPRRSMGRGMVETQRPLNDAMDLLMNQSVDTGMLVNQPMFGYRRNSTFEPEEMRVNPGMGIPCDDPNADIRFFNWNVNPSWSQGIIGLLQSSGQQLTSLGPLSSGQVGANVGPLRSNAGAKTLLGETEVNMDIILKQFAIPYSNMMEGLFADVVERMPESVQISVTGPDGDPTLSEDGKPQQIKISPRELRARLHFGIYANSQNLNRGAQADSAMKIAQFLLQPVGLQTGVIKPENVYEIYHNVVKTQAIPQAYRYLSKPANQMALPLQIELYMIAQGLEPMIVLNDPQREFKLEEYSKLIDSEGVALEVQYGKTSPEALNLLQKTFKKHEKFFQVTNKPTNLVNPTGTNEGFISEQGPAPQEDGQPSTDDGTGAAPPPPGAEAPDMNLPA